MARLDEVSGEQRQIANRAAAAKARLRRLAASAISSSGSELSAVFGANSPAEARERLTSIQSISHSAAEAAREWEASARQLDGDTTAAANEAAAATNERELAVGAAAEAVRRHNEAAAELESARVAAGIGPRTVPDIPNRVLVAYLRAAQWSAKVAPECRMTWWALAAIGRVESGHARSAAVAEDGSTYPHIVGIPLNGSRGTAVIGDSDGGTFDDDPDYDRAVGPMQFIPTTWASSGVDASGDGVADPHNIYDAAFAAARYLCAGARGMPVDTEAGFRAAAFSYNHSAAYVSTVWDGSAAYRALAAAA
ncbi:MAG: lytic transglycosylase domain-containing protein [Microthrixaceae bacterium]|nr:lytic transglycosylase domain-containing protein [Microthrixaceae bacterium]